MSKADTKWSSVDSKMKLASLYYTLQHAEIICFDIETQTDKGKNTEDFRPDSRITSASFSLKKGYSYVVPLSHPAAPWSSRWHEIAISLANTMKGSKLVAHNAKYDIRWMRSMTGVDLTEDLWWDTMVSAYVLDENGPKALKEVAPLEFGIESWADVNLKDSEGLDWKDLARYNARDTDYTLRLVNRHKKRLLEQRKLARVFKYLMMPTVRTLVGRVERDGILLDWELALDRLATYQGRVKALEEELEAFIPDELHEKYGDKRPHVHTDECSDPCRKRVDQRKPISWSPSSSFFKDFMLAIEAPVLEVTPNGQPSWDATVMKRLASMGMTQVSKIMEHRQHSKWVGFLKSWLDYRWEDGRVRPSFKPATVVTGRLSCEGPNMQQVDKHLKDVWVSREGWWFVQADYSQIELRIAAMISGDKAMLKAYRRGDDLHTLMASEIVNKPPEEVTKEERQSGKIGNFGFLYGMGVDNFLEFAFSEYGIDFEYEEATRIRALFFQRWRGIGLWHDRMEKSIRMHGFVRSPLGRMRRLPDVYSDNPRLQSSAIRQAINFPVQSFASDLMLLSLSKLAKMFGSEEVALVGTVHDSLLMEVREDRLKPVLQDTARVMLCPDIKRSFGAEVTVPLEVEFQIGRRWGEERPKVLTVKGA